MTHDLIDKRAITFTRITVWLIDHDPARKGLLCAKKNLARLPRNDGYYRWKALLALPWHKLRKEMRKQTEEMQYLRQMTPFYGPDCMPESIRRRVVNKYLTRFCGSKPILFQDNIVFPAPLKAHRRKRFTKVHV